MNSTFTIVPSLSELARPHPRRPSLSVGDPGEALYASRRGLGKRVPRPASTRSRTRDGPRVLRMDTRSAGIVPSSPIVGCGGVPAAVPRREAPAGGPTVSPPDVRLGSESLFGFGRNARSASVGICTRNSCCISAVNRCSVVSCRSIGRGGRLPVDAHMSRTVAKNSTQYAPLRTDSGQVIRPPTLWGSRETPPAALAVGATALYATPVPREHVLSAP